MITKRITMIFKIEDRDRKEKIAREILCGLQEWFVLPESTSEYITYSKEMSFWADMENKQARGFIALKETSTYTLEIYVMGVLKEFHRYKIGTHLFKVCYDYAKE